MSIKITNWQPEEDWALGLFSEKQSTNITALQTDLATFQEKGRGIILLKQKYSKLFYNPKEQLKTPIKQIVLTLLDNKKEVALTITISNHTIRLQYLSDQDHPQKTEEEKPQRVLFPSAEDAAKILNKKIWIQINKLDSTLRIFEGDLGDTENNISQPLFFKDFSLDFPENSQEPWANQHDVYPYPDKKFPTKVPRGQSERKKALLKNIKFLKVEVEVDLPSNKQKISDEQIGSELSHYLTVKLLNLKTSPDSAVDTKPSAMAQMPKGTNDLYNFLSKLEISKLPDYEYSQKDFNSQYQHPSWKKFSYAVHSSLLTPFAIKNGKPIGIMNHLFKMKMGRQYEPLTFLTAEGKEAKNRDELLEEIHKNREGYLRLELPNEGTNPGTQVVIDVWPPYNCSCIHDHGDSFGLVKVLAGNITVQNYEQLTLCDLDTQKPFQERVYKEDQCTWLSQTSFGIHRLLNLHSQTCLNIQAYYHDQNANINFCVIKQNEQAKKDYADFSNYRYTEVFPQNDWKDYLYLAPKLEYKVNTVQKIYQDLRKKEKKWETLTENEKELIKEIPESLLPTKKFDLQFLNLIIANHDLKKPNKHIEWSFSKLVSILIDEYEFIEKFNPNPASPLLPKTNKPNVIYWLGEPLLEQSSQLEIIKLPDVKSLEQLLATEGQQLALLGKKIIFINNLKVLNNPVLNLSVSSNSFKQLNSKHKFPKSLKIAYSPHESKINKEEGGSTNLFSVTDQKYLVALVQEYLGLTSQQKWKELPIYRF